MAITSGYFNSVNGDRKYNADQMSEYFDAIVNQGVFQHYLNGLAVSAGTGLSVSVATGKAVIQSKWVKNDAAVNLTISAASTSYARIDAVVIRLSNSNRTVTIAVKDGTPSANPSAPSMTRNSSTYEMALAYVNVAANATSVTVTDKRSDTSVCGWATVAQETSGEVDAMLEAMKTGFDGVTYSSPAAMVQGCDQKINNKITLSPYNCMEFDYVWKYFKASAGYAISPVKQFIKYRDYEVTGGSNQNYGVVLDAKQAYMTTSKAYSSGDVESFDYSFVIDVDFYAMIQVKLQAAGGSWGVAGFQRSVYVTPGRNVIPCDNMMASASISANVDFRVVSVSLKDEFDSTSLSTNMKFDVAVVTSASIGSYNTNLAFMADIAQNAGFKRFPLPILNTGGNISTVSFKTENEKSIVTVAPYTTSSAGFKYSVFKILDISSVIGKGYKLFCKVKNQSLDVPISVLGIATGGTSASWGTWAWTKQVSSLEWTAFVDIDSIEGIQSLSSPNFVFGLSNANAPASTESTITNEISIMLISKDNTVLATNYIGSWSDSGLVTEEQYKSDFPELSGDEDMIFWGDSLTAGAGGNGTTYCKVCADLLGKTFKNCGVGGETENTIAARQGGNNMIIPAGSVNGTYSSENMLDGYGHPIQPLKQGSGSDTVNPVLINGQSCQISYDSDTNNYSISGYTGTLLTAVPALFSGYTSYADITVIWVGTNGIGQGNTVNERISIIKSMLSRVGKKYVVLGISMGTESERSADDAAMQEAFGNHFFPTRKMMVNYGLAVQGITPTAQDTTDIASGTVPSSLRADAVHFNADGYAALGKMLAAKIVGLGYATYADN